MRIEASPVLQPRASDGTGWRRAVLAAGLVALSRPTLWPVALAGFLVRGGIVVLLAPIVVLPTATGIANVVAPGITVLALSGVTSGVVELALVAAVSATALLIAACLGGAWVDAQLIRAAVLDDDAPMDVAQRNRAIGSTRLPKGTVWQLVAIRLVALLPLLVAVLFAAAVIVDATYHELILPEDVSRPLILRVVLDVPEAIVVIGIAWLVTETLAGLAARRVVLDHVGPVRAIGGAFVDVCRRPVTTLLTLLLGLAWTIAFVAPSLVAASFVWGEVRVALVGGGVGLTAIAATLLFVAIWGGGLLLAAFCATWRSVLWTFEARRARSARQQVDVLSTASDAGRA